MVEIRDVLELSIKVLFLLLIGAFDRCQQAVVTAKSSGGLRPPAGRTKIFDLFLCVVAFLWSIYEIYGWEAMVQFFRTNTFFAYIVKASIAEQMLIFVVLLLHMLLGALFVWPALRAWLMPKLRLDPARYMHRVAVAWMISHIIYFIYKKSFAQHVFGDFMESIESGWFILFFSFHDALLGLMAVGYGMVRNGKETIARLGLDKKPTGRGFLLSLLLLAACMLVESILQHIFSPLAHTPGTSHEVVISMSGFATLAIVLFPAIGEELLYRGALQPRLGIWATSILFATTHVQYGWLGLCSIFLSSLLYGWVARRYSIWLSIFLHMCTNAVVAITSIKS